MKKIAIFITTFLVSTLLIAQPPGDKRKGDGFEKGNHKFNGEKVQAAYVGFVTQKLELTETEAQQFWPLHNQMDKELKAIDKNAPELEKQQKLLDIRKQYSPKFVKIIGAERTEKFWKMQANFMKMLKNRMDKKRGEEGNKLPIKNK